MICWGDPHFPSPTHYGSRNLRLGRTFSISSSSSSETSEVQDSAGPGSDDHRFTEFKYQDLKKSTKNFTMKVGQGLFGSVFKGTYLLSDSSSRSVVNIAVKRLHGVDTGEKQMFLDEINNTKSINHVNIVRLRGFCTDRSNRFLVYDYIPNGSLASHLSRNDSSVTVTALTWEARYKIATGIAKGLAYLHEKCSIIHCDIKPENVLLDSELVVPKIACFWVAVGLGNLTRVQTTIRGTRGYVAPEWFIEKEITSKVDVYSYGMLLFEIISGKRNVNMNTLSENFFPDQASDKILKGEDVVELLDDDCILKDWAAEVTQLRRACRVACWCIQDDETQRPTMSQVVRILEQQD